MDADEDYWAILGLEPGATQLEVNKAYRKRSLAVHPDRYKEVKTQIRYFFIVETIPMTLNFGV